MNRSRNHSILLVALGFAILLTLGLPRYAAAVNSGETLYLADSATQTDGVTYLYSVHIDPLTNRANLTLLPNGAIPFNMMLAIACTPDGSRIYGVDTWHATDSLGTGELGYYDVANHTWNVINYVMHGPDIVGGVVLAGFSPSGVLYIASATDDNLYTVNLNTAEATPIGPAVNTATGARIHEQGADLAFTAAGDLYLWTNTANPAGAPSGLYKLNLGAATDHVPATFIGTVPGDFFTGVAIRANGYGDMAGSTHSGEVHTQSLTTAQDTAGSPHPMYLNGAPYDYHYGDMSNGALELCTRTIGYYKNHNWNRAITICGVPITQDGVNATEDGQGFLNGQDYGSKPNGTDFSMLFAQLIAAKLNTSNASGVGVIDPAEAWLCSQDVVLPSGGLDFHAQFTSMNQKNTANSYAGQLDTFNNSSESNCSSSSLNSNSLGVKSWGGGHGH